MIENIIEIIGSSKRFITYLHEALKLLSDMHGFKVEILYFSMHRQIFTLNGKVKVTVQLRFVRHD